MVVQDLTIYVTITIALIYLIVYQRNKMVGDILFLGVGLGMWSVLSSSEGWLGLAVIACASIALVYDSIASIQAYQHDITGNGEGE